MTYARIIGTGSYLPERVLSNADLEKMVETSDEWIQSRTGIKQRHIVAKGETTTDLASNAAVNALEMAGIQASDLDLIVLATTTPDKIFPGTATLVQDHLGAYGCPAFDVQAVCSGFVYALDIADKYIRSGSAKKALVIGAESFSRIIDWTDRKTCVLFGDGAGAVVLGADEETGIHSTHIYADGRHNCQLMVDGHVSGGQIVDGPGFASMNGGEVFKFAVNKMAEAMETALDANNMKASDLDWLIPHQANVRILNAVAKKLSVWDEQVIVTVPEHGNTSAASIPLALDTGVRDGRVQAGQKLGFVAMGGGFTWGSSLLTF